MSFATVSTRTLGRVLTRSTMLPAALVFGLTAGPSMPALAQPVEEAPPAVDLLETPDDGLVDASEVDGDAVFANVNGEPLTMNDLNMIVQWIGEGLFDLPADQQQEIVLGEAVDFMLVVQAAEALGFNQEEGFIQTLEFIRQRALRDAYIQRVIAPRVTDEQVQEAYDQLIAGMNLPVEVQISVIQVATEAQANEILSNLSQGGSFSDLAVQFSTHESASNGGLVPQYFQAGMLNQAIGDAAFGLEEGTVSAPILITGDDQFPDNWFIIKVEDRRQQPGPPLDSVSEDLRNELMRQEYAVELDRLANEADIEFLDPTEEGDLPLPEPVLPPADLVPAPEAPSVGP